MHLAARSLRIAMLAPPWIPVPPPAYGGIENVVDLLSTGLVRRGHSVTLFAAPGSHSVASVHPLLAAPHPDEIGQSRYEADHVARAFAAIDRAAFDGCPFDVVHDHSGFVALTMADRLATPMVHTLHGSFNATSEVYAEHGHKAAIVPISHAQRAQAPPDFDVGRVIPNPIDVGQWPLENRKDDYLLWIGRLDPDKGPHRAIDAARRAGRRIILAGPIQPGEERFFESEVKPRLDGEQARFIGEVGGQPRRDLFARASALLMPIRWREPFGMVMVEALACGTPVIAFPEGDACEIVNDGENGFLVADELEMALAIARLGELDPSRCRASVASRFDVDVVSAAYEELYGEQALTTAAARPESGLRHRPSAARHRPRHTAGVTPIGDGADSTD